LKLTVKILIIFIFFVFFYRDVVAQKMGIRFCDSGYCVEADYFDKTGFHYLLYKPVAMYLVTMPEMVSARAKPYIKGFVAYEYLYRSQLDTPFLQKDFQQHTERVFLRTNVLGNVPVVLNVAARQNNSPYLKNRLDFNVKYDLEQIKKQLLEQLKAKSLAALQVKEKLETLKQQIIVKETNLHTLRTTLSNELLLEKVLKEQSLFLANANDSLKNVLKGQIETGQLNIDNDTLFPVLKEYSQIKRKYNEAYSSYLQMLQFKNKLSKDAVATEMQDIKALRSGMRNKDLVKKYGDAVQSKGMRYLFFLNSFKTIELGRCVLDYSELTYQQCR
jgi:hypothetical protein